jgi:hypothetical protein
VSARAPAWWSLLVQDAVVLDRHVREGRFQRSLSAVAGFSGLLGGLEVTLQHYRGSYNQRVMYTPVALGLGLFAAGVGRAVSPRFARTVLPIASGALLADGLAGFGFHVRGIARKPGGWKVPVTNVVMGPPARAGAAPVVPSITLPCMGRAPPAEPAVGRGASGDPRPGGALPARARRSDDRLCRAQRG